MKPIRIATDVVSVGELKVHAAKLLDRIRDERRPIVITQHGKPAAVLIRPEDYDRLVEQLWFVTAVEEGLEQSKRGEGVDDAELDPDLEKALEPRKSR
jgi:prevent-host-death family protein